MCELRKIVVTIVAMMVVVTALAFAGGRAEERAEDTKLEFIQQSVEVVEIYNILIAKFEEENPDIKIFQNNIRDPGPVLMSRFASGDPPDIFTDYPLRPEFRAKVTEGYVHDVTDQPWARNIRDDVADILLKMSDGIYGLPLSQVVMGVFYNKEIFDRYGLSVPESYAELLELSETLQAEGETPFIFADRGGETIGQFTRGVLSASYMDNRDEFFWKLAHGETSAHDNPQYRRMAEIILELREYGQEDYLGTDRDHGYELFATGKGAMHTSGLWAIPSIKAANPDLDFGIFPFPPEDGRPLKMSIVFDTFIAVANDGAQMEAALKFLEFLSRPENAQLYSDMENTPSAIKGVELRTDDYPLLVEAMAEAELVLFPNDFWGPGMIRSHQVAVQELVVSRDIDAFLDQTDRDFRGSLDGFEDVYGERWR